MSKYPCNVIKDLLPSFIDNVCSDSTAEDIKEHLKECPSCKALYESMKEDLPSESGLTNSSEEEKKVIKKVTSKIEKNNKVTKILCICIIFFVILAASLFIIPVKKIPRENLDVSVHKEILTPVIDDSTAKTQESINPDFPPNTDTHSFNSPNAWSDNTLFIYPSDKNIEDCVFYKAVINNYPNYSFAIDSSYLDQNADNYINVITVSSDYAIKTYSEEYINDNGSIIFNLKNARTTLMGMQATGAESHLVLFSIDDIDGYTVYGNP